MLSICGVKMLATATISVTQIHISKHILVAPTSLHGRSRVSRGFGSGKSRVVRLLLLSFPLSARVVLVLKPLICRKCFALKSRCSLASHANTLVGEHFFSIHLGMFDQGTERLVFHTAMNAVVPAPLSASSAKMGPNARRTTLSKASNGKRSRTDY